MPRRVKVDLSNPKKRDALPARSSYYAHALGSQRYVLMRKGARGSVWGARVPGKPDCKLGPVETMDFDQVADLVRDMDKAEVTEEKPDALVTFGEAIDAYDEWAEKTKGKQSYAVIKSHIRQMDALRPMLITTTPKRVLTAWCNDLLTDRRGPFGANKVIGSLKAALNSYGIDGPWQKLRKFSEADVGTDDEAVVMTVDQVNAILTVADEADPDLGLFLRAMWLVGARPGEIQGVTVKAFRGSALTLTGKTGTRHITLTPKVAEWFADNIKAVAALPDKRDAFRYRWDDLVEACGDAVPEGVVMYSLRHSFITQALYLNVPIFAIAKHTGTSPAMIMRTYGHVIAELQAEAFQTMEQVLL